MQFTSNSPCIKIEYYLEAWGNTTKYYATEILTNVDVIGTSVIVKLILINILKFYLNYTYLHSDYLQL